MTDEGTVKVFVYGTLKVGGRLSHQLDGERLSVTPAKIKGTMVNVKGLYPGLLATGNGDIHGELHSYPKSVVSRLDRIEGAPYLYRRVSVKAAVDSGEEDAIAYEFAQSTEGMEVIPSGKWDI